MNQLLVTRLTAVVALCAMETAAAGIVSNFAPLGTSNFTVDGGSTIARYTQTTTNLTLVSPFQLGDTLGGIFSSPYNWSAFSNTNNWTLAISMSAAGASPNTGFTVELFNGALDAVVMSYYGSTIGLVNSPSFVFLDAVFNPSYHTGDFSSIGGMQFTWDQSGYGSVTLEKIGFPTLVDLTPTAVPEPGTWAAAVLLISSAAFVSLRRRKA